MAALLLISILPLAFASPSYLGISGVSYEARSPQSQGLHGYGGYLYGGIGYGKREAEPSYLLRSTLGVHPTGVSSSDRSVQGLSLGRRLGLYSYVKREAEPYFGSASVSLSQVDPGYGGGYLSSPAAFNYGFSNQGFTLDSGVSSQLVSRPTSQYQVGQSHPYRKREAEPSYLIGSTLGVHPTGVSSSDRSVQGLSLGRSLGVYSIGKREAEPFLGTASVSLSQVDPGYAAFNYGFSNQGLTLDSGVSSQVVSRPSSQYQVGQSHPYGKREAEPSYLIRSTLGVHPTGVSSSDRSVQGLSLGHSLGVYSIGKREAEPSYLLRSTLGVHPTGVSYSDRSAQGLSLGRPLGIYSYLH